MFSDVIKTTIKNLLYCVKSYKIISIYFNRQKFRSIIIIYRSEMTAPHFSNWAHFESVFNAPFLKKEGIIVFRKLTLFYW